MSMSSRNLAVISVAIIVLVGAVGWWFLRPAPEPSPEPTPIVEERLIRITGIWPTHIDPAIGTDSTSYAGVRNMYDPFVTLTWDGIPEPHLATSWEVSEDYLTWTIQLREGVKFHDGSELTAEDVAFSMNRMLAMGTGFSYVFTPYIESAEVVDEYIVQFNMKTQYGPFIPVLVYLHILNKDLVMEHTNPTGLYGEHGDYGTEWLLTHDAGSGPYKVRDYRLEEQLTMERFEEYWGEIQKVEGKGFAEYAPDVIMIMNINEPVTQRIMMANRELETCMGSKEMIDELMKIGGFNKAAFFRDFGWALSMNNRKPPLDDIHVRKALNWAFPWEENIKQVWIDSVQTVGCVPIALPGKNFNAFKYHTNMTMALEELKQSKYYHNISDYEIELHWCSGMHEERKTAMLFMDAASKIGVNIKVVETPWLTICDESARIETAPHIMYIGSGGGPEAGHFFISRFHSECTGSWEQNEWLLDPELDKMIDDAIKIIDIEERFAKYAEIEDYIMSICPSIFPNEVCFAEVWQDYVGMPLMNEKYLVEGTEYVYNPGTLFKFDYRLYNIYTH